MSPRRSTSGGVGRAPVSSPADGGLYVWRGWPWAVVNAGEYVCIEEEGAGYQPTPIVNGGGWEERGLGNPGMMVVTVHAIDPPLDRPLKTPPGGTSQSPLGHSPLRLQPQAQLHPASFVAMLIPKSGGQISAHHNYDPGTSGISSDPDFCKGGVLRHSVVPSLWAAVDLSAAKLLIALRKSESTTSGIITARLVDITWRLLDGGDGFGFWDGVGMMSAHSNSCVQRPNA